MPLLKSGHVRQKLSECKPTFGKSHTHWLYMMKKSMQFPKIEGYTVFVKPALKTEHLLEGLGIIAHDTVSSS